MRTCLRPAVTACVLLLCIATAAESQTTNIRPLKKSRDRAARAMNSLLYGPAEMPNQYAAAADEGPAASSCTARTRTEFEKDIASVIDGAIQLATFWRPSPCASANHDPCPLCSEHSAAVPQK